MSKTNVAEALGLIGITLALFSFIFGSWSGVLTGLDILFEVAQQYIQPGTMDGVMSIPGENPFNRIISILIVSISLSLVSQVVILPMTFRTRNIAWISTKAAVSFFTLTLLSVLLINFRARQNGIIITALGALLILISAALTLFYEKKHLLLDRGKAAIRLRIVWEERLKRAAVENTPVSILAMKTQKFWNSHHTGIITRELRVGDSVFPVKNGSYVLIWNTDAEKAANVARHLQHLLLKECQIESQIGIACYPADDDDIIALVEKAEDDLKSRLAN